MNEIIQITGGLLGLALLYFGAEWLVKGGSSIAERCHVSPLIVGLTLVAFGTSAPELFVSVDAALSNMGDMSVGNVVGSNICNIVLILGLSAAINPLTVNAILFKRDVPVMIVASILVAILCGYFHGIDRIAGAVLFCGLIVYMITGIITAKKSPATITNKNKQFSVTTSILAIIGGLASLVTGSKLLLGAAVFTAKCLSIPDSIVALTIVAVGTSLPELATSVVAAAKGEKDIAIGNVVGSNIFNLLGIMGISSLANPIKCPGISNVDLCIMIGTAMILWPIMKTGHKISRIEGFFLLFIYVAYTSWLIYTI